MRKYIVSSVIVLGILVSPAFTQAAALTTNQANSLIAVIQSAPGVPASAFVNLITSFSNITINQATSLVAVVQSAPNVPASAFVNLLISFTSGDTVTSTTNQAVTPTQPTIATASLPSGIVGNSYSISISGNSGSSVYDQNHGYAWSISGLPPGLTNSLPAGAAGTCQYGCSGTSISGTPTIAGTYTVTATLNSGSQTVSKQFSLVIAVAGVTVSCQNFPPPNFCPGGTADITVTGTDTSGCSTYGCKSANTLSITTTSLLDGTVGTPYSATLTATGGTGSYVWSAVLPSWLSINSTTGVISGVPNTSGIGNENMGYTLGITLTSGEQTVFKYINLTILWSPNGILTIEGGPGPGQSAIAGVPDSAGFGFSGIGGGSDQYVWSISGLPPELSLLNDTCPYPNSSWCSSSTWRAQSRITGTPTTIGKFPITVTLTCGTQTISKQFILGIVASVNAPTATLSQSVNTTTSDGTTGQSFILTWWGSSNATSCSMSKTVNGGASQSVSCYASSPTLLGSCQPAPATVGTHIFTFSCTGPDGSDSQSVTHYVVSSTNAPSITTTSLPNGTVGTSYSASLDGRGSTWSASGLPAGLNLSGIVSNSTCSGPTPTSPVSPCPTSTSITGTPTVGELLSSDGNSLAGFHTYTVTVTLASDAQTVSKQFSLVIALQAPISLMGGANQTASVLNAVNGLTSNNSASQTQTSFTYVWNRDLQIGSTGADVSALQTALTKEGVYTGEITGGFYNQTFTAVKAFQQKYGIETTGYVGPITRAKLNALY